MRLDALPALSAGAPLLSMGCAAADLHLIALAPGGSQETESLFRHTDMDLLACARLDALPAFPFGEAPCP